MADDNQEQPSDVVSLANERRRRKRYDAPALPERTGVAQIDEVSPTLLANLRESNLSDATIEAARLFAVPSVQVRRFGFRSQPGQGAALLLPYFEPDARAPHGYRMRPIVPIEFRDRRSGKIRRKKYDQPRGTDLLVYCPPLPATLDHRRELAQPLYWTEGEKKALYLSQLGLCAVGLSGVDCWHDVERVDRGEGRHLHRFILEHYAVAGRAHVIVFDGDARSNGDVQRAMSTLAGALIAAGAASVFACLPPEGGAKGIDDYGHAYGDDAALSLLTSVRDAVDALMPSEGCLPLRRFECWKGSGAEGLRLPLGYDCERNGSIVLHEREDEPPRDVLDAPMGLARCMVDGDTGELKYAVVFRDPAQRWHTVAVPRAQLGDRGMLTALRPYGAPVDATNLAHVVRYLSAFERDNGMAMPTTRCVAHAGWHGAAFTLGAPMVPAGNAELELAVTPEQQRVFDALRIADGATVEAHIEALRVGYAASSDFALLVLSTLAAPLLHVLNVPNFVLHLCGDTSRGKTSMLRAAASVYGDPYDPHWVASWNSTAFAIEQRAALLCDLPLYFDELGAAEPGEAERLVYMLANGQSRGRGTKDLAMRPALHWRTVVCSTGERELADETTPAGTRARVINLPVDGIGELSAVEVERFARGCAAQHGALGHAWVQWLLMMEPAGIAELRAVYADLTAELRRVAEAAGDRLGARVAAYYGLMQLIELAVAQTWGLGELDGSTVARAFRVEREAGGEQRIDTVAERVVAVLRDWVAENPACFPLVSRVGPEEPRRVLGYRLRGTQVAFLPTPLKEYLRSQRLTWTRSLGRDLIRMGVLMPEHGRGIQSRISVDGERVSVMAMRFAGQD